MSQISLRVRSENLRSLAFGSISGTYAAVGAPLLNSSIILWFQNQTDQPIFLSDDGINDKWYLSSSAFLLVDLCANKASPVGREYPLGTQFYARTAGSSPTLGGVYISSFFASDF